MVDSAGSEEDDSEDPSGTDEALGAIPLLKVGWAHGDCNWWDVISDPLVLDHVRHDGKDDFYIHMDGCATYAIGGAYSAFTATVGITDKSRGDIVVDVVVSGDGTELPRVRVKVGDPEDIDLPVQGVMQLKISTYCQETCKEANSGYTNVAVVDAVLHP